MDVYEAVDDSLLTNEVAQNASAPEARQIIAGIAYSMLHAGMEPEYVVAQIATLASCVAALVSETELKARREAASE